jgi:hypothetical protein
MKRHLGGQLDLGLTRNLNVRKKYFVAGIKESTQQTHKFVVRKKSGRQT